MKEHKNIDIVMMFVWYILAAMMNLKYLIDIGEDFLSLSLDIDIIESILLKLVNALTNPTRRRMNPMDSCIVTWLKCMCNAKLNNLLRDFNMNRKLWYEDIGSVDCEYQSNSDNQYGTSKRYKTSCNYIPVVSWRTPMS
jgi:hypothetical protein